MSPRTPSLTGWHGHSVPDESKANRPAGHGATCSSCEPNQRKAPLIHTKINLKCKPARSRPSVTPSTTPQPILQPAGLPCHTNFTYKSLPRPSPPPFHILLTFFATQTASPNASFGDITDSHGLLLVSHLFLQALPQ